jgi:hypothetical protein
MPSSKNMKTIAAVSAPRHRQAPAELRAPLTAEEKKEKRESSKDKQERIDDAVGNSRFSFFLDISDMILKESGLLTRMRRQ